LNVLKLVELRVLSSEFGVRSGVDVKVIIVVGVNLAAKIEKILFSSLILDNLTTFLTSDFGLPTSDFSLGTSVFRLRSSDFFTKPNRRHRRASSEHLFRPILRCSQSGLF
jgi:hypothetical protein